MLPKNFLTPRLSAILEQISVCETFADIGTDHAYLPIAAVLEEKAARAYATDVHLGPVQKAENNIALFGLSDQISVLLGDGLLPLIDFKVDVIAIAGMGGCLMRDILQRHWEWAENCSQIILQPMREVYVLREFLCQKEIYFNETIVREERRFYHILSVYPQKGQKLCLKPLAIRFGVFWLNEDPLFWQEAKQTVAELQTIEERITGTKAEALVRKETCRAEREFLQELILEHESKRNSIHH